jgi:hypothetical protein
MPQVEDLVEHLPSKHKTLSSTPSIFKKKKRRRRKEEVQMVNKYRKKCSTSSAIVK